VKKQIAVALVTSALLGIAGTTQAGNSERDQYGRFSGGHDRNHYSYGGHFNDRMNHQGKNRHHHHGHDDFGDGLAIVAGVLVLGSIIHAMNHDASRHVGQQPVPPGPVQDYWYRVDGDGRCVEVRLNQQGREVWTYVDPSYCN